ncbi:TonB-dependent receptor [Mariprofundus erugo]|uniref:TonB-dependent receptor n=1 Tax=Mariprofundus erugo TaxID=2528639 RepID=UPI0010FDDFB7|nr:TonB-dependent receptor plug domain-containing protein [Mariprofundus erugo]TLS77571.1 TonB-dependent receptor [Mariprofundus erugo]
MTYKPLIATSLLIAMTTSAQAADLGEINVTANRTEASTSTSPHTVTIIERKVIEQSHAENVVELLKGQPGIVVSDSSGIGAKAQVDLGGFGESAASNSVVLVDGRRINSPDLSGTDWTQIPVDQIERIEIMHSGGSVLYGQGAVGGVINIITRIPEDGGNISVEGGSFATVGSRVRAGATTGKIRMEGNFSGLKSDGYRKNSKIERYDGGLRGEIDLSEAATLYFSGNHHIDRTGLPGPLTQAQMQANRKQSLTPANYANATDDFINAGVMADIGAVHIDLPASYRKRDSNAVYGAFTMNGKLNTLSLRPKFDFEQAIAGITSHLVGGSDIERTTGTFGGIKSRRNTAGYYGFATLSDADGRFAISGGYRGENSRDQLMQGGNSSISNHKGVYDIGLTATLGGFHLGINHSTSVRMPLVDERFDWFTGNWNQALRMQTGKHVGISGRYGNDHSYAELTFSRAELTDEIFFNPLTFANENYNARTRHDVMMLSGRWDAGQLLKFGGNITRNHASFRGGIYAGRAIPAVARMRAGADWTADWSKQVQSILKLTYVGPSYLISDQANARPQLPAYLLVDTVLNFSLKNMELFVRVDNLTNKQYSSYGVTSAFAGDNYYPAAGIGVRAGASYHF